MTDVTWRSPIAFLVGLLALTVFAGAPARADDIPSKPPELKVLEGLIGDWTTEATVTVLNGQPQNLKTTGTAIRCWTLNGRFVEESGKSSDGAESKTLFTYDVAKTSFRMWYFDSAGTSLAMAGQFSETTQTFTLAADLGNGLTQAATIHFVDKDHHEWTSKVTDASGKVLFEGKGSLARKK